MSFRRRLALVSAAAVAIAIVVASVVVYVVVRDRLRDEVDSSLEDFAAGATIAGTPVPAGVRDAVRLPRSARRGELPGPPIAGHRWLPGAHGHGRVSFRLPRPALGVPFSGFGQLVDANGRILPAPGELGRLPVSEATRQVAAGSRAAFYEDVHLRGSHLRVLTVPAGPGRALEVARSLDEVDDTLRHLAIVLALVSLGGVGLAAILGALVSRTAVAPVTRLSETAEHVARTRDLGRRIEVAGDDELARLARSFNAMLAELDAALTAQRQLVADASHELRTPLTSLRTNIEVLARPNGLPDGDRHRLLEDVVGQLGELGSLVSNLVDLAREEEPPLAEAPIELDRLVAGCVARAQRRHREVRFVSRLEPCTVRGLPDRIERATDNLLDNAVKWSPAGGRVDVSVTADGAITVSDQGPGIAAEDLPHVFERFYRAPSARGLPGSGLGLAIVRQVAEAHGGRVTVETSPGPGTRVVLALPTGQPSPNSSLDLT